MKTRVLLLFVSLVFCQVSSGERAFQMGKRAFESGNKVRAINLFDKAIAEARTKAEKNLAYYYQGLLMFDIGAYYSSFISFRNVLLTASKKNKNVYGKAIKNAVIIADKLGMTDSMGGALSKFPQSYIPSNVSDLSHYAIGVYYATKGRDRKASSHLKSVHPESQFHNKALFNLGILATKKKNYKEAIYYFQKVRARTSGRKEQSNLSELAKLNLARVVYASGNIEASIELYSRFYSSSPQWLTVLFEASWPLMRVNDTTVSLGNLHTILSPFYQEDLVGEGYILRATILFTLCKYEEMRQTLNQFFKTYDKVMREMQTEKSRLGSAQAFYESYVTKQGGINRSFRNYADRDQGIQSDLKVLEMLRRERALVSRFRTNGQMQRMAKLNEKASALLQRRIGVTLAKLHRRKLAELLQQREQANYLKVEIVTGEKELIEGQQGLPPKRVVDVETSVASGYRFWPFMGEYWEDELGAYVYLSESSCVN